MKIFIINTPQHILSLGYSVTRYEQRNIKTEIYEKFSNIIRINAWIPETISFPLKKEKKIRNEQLSMNFNVVEEEFGLEYKNKQGRENKDGRKERKEENAGKMENKRHKEIRERREKRRDERKREDTSAEKIKQKGRHEMNE